MTTVNSEADRYLQLCLDEYHQRGGIPPKLIVSTNRGMEFVFVLRQGRHPGDTAAELLARLNALLDVELTVFMCEAWGMTAKVEDVPGDMARGKLEEMRKGGNTDVHTNVMVAVTDGLERTMRIYDVDAKVDITRDSLKLTGYLTHVLIDALRFGREQRRNVSPTLYFTLRACTPVEIAEALGTALGMTGLVEAIMIGAEDREAGPEAN